MFNKETIKENTKILVSEFHTKEFNYIEFYPMKFYGNCAELSGETKLNNKKIESFTFKVWKTGETDFRMFKN